MFYLWKLPKVKDMCIFQLSVFLSMLMFMGYQFPWHVSFFWTFIQVTHLLSRNSIGLIKPVSKSEIMISSLMFLFLLLFIDLVSTETISGKVSLGNTFDFLIWNSYYNNYMYCCDFVFSPESDP